MVLTVVSVSAEGGHLEVLGEGLVEVALADQQEGVDMMEMMVSEAVAQEATITEVTLDVGRVDQEEVDMAADTAVDTVDA